MPPPDVASLNPDYNHSEHPLRGRLCSARGLGLALLARDGALGIVAGRPLDHAGGVEKAQDAVRWLSAFGEPALRFLNVEFQPLCVVLREERIEVAEPLDKTAVARITAVRHHDVIDRPLLGAGT